MEASAAAEGAPIHPVTGFSARSLLYVNVSASPLPVIDRYHLPFFLMLLLQILLKQLLHQLQLQVPRLLQQNQQQLPREGIGGTVLANRNTAGL